MENQVLIGTALCTDGSCYCADDLGTEDTLSDSSLISCLKYAFLFTVPQYSISKFLGAFMSSCVPYPLSISFPVPLSNSLDIKTSPLPASGLSFLQASLVDHS